MDKEWWEEDEPTEKIREYWETAPKGYTAPPNWWTYPWNTYFDSPRFPWWRKWLISIGGDEYGRHTIVIPIPFVAHLVIVLW